MPLWLVLVGEVGRHLICDRPQCVARDRQHLQLSRGPIANASDDGWNKGQVPIEHSVDATHAKAEAQSFQSLTPLITSFCEVARLRRWSQFDGTDGLDRGPFQLGSGNRRNLSRRRARTRPPLWPAQLECLQ